MERLNFASSRYLGLRHPGRTLPDFTALTTGVPAAVGVPQRSRCLASQLASLVGGEAATLGPSTLHLFFDLFHILAKPGTAIVAAGDIYPIASWGIERAAGQGAFATRAPSNDPRQVRHAIARLTSCNLRPIVVTDGLAIQSGRPAQLAVLLEIVRDHQGLLVVDDTQALGLLGSAPSPDQPYGAGGGGSLRWHDIGGGDIVTVSSLAKGFGVPLAVMAGSRERIQRFEAASKTRVHCSPPNSAAIAAGLRALSINRAAGDQLRRRLLRNVLRFRAGLGRSGLTADGELFPIQTLRAELDVGRLHRTLASQGIDALLLQPDRHAPPRLALVLSARHQPHEIDRAVQVLVQERGPTVRQVRHRSRPLTASASPAWIA